MKRATLKPMGSVASPVSAVKTLKSATHTAIMRGRPMRSAKVPRKIAPSMVPNNADPAMTPALVASTPMSFMIDGSAAPTTARS
ncbi:hypothetical protein FQZ97_648770 [compost metagenome]